MPSGISHMLLSRYLPVEADRPYSHKMRANTRYFQIGSIAPDLPYASVTDNDFLDSDSELANIFHFTSPGQAPSLAPNRLPLMGLEQVKTFIENGADKRGCDAFFWFLVGYASHLIADGVCHPYVMDKVGRYEGSNKAVHRALEMGIDVLLFKHFTGDRGHAIEAGYARMDTYIKGFNDLKYSNMVCNHFANLIESIYGRGVQPEEIAGWVEGMARLFCLSTGRWPNWFRTLDATRPFVFREIADLDGQEDDYLALERPRFWDENFLGRDRIHFFEDCLPRFNEKMIDFMEKAWAFVYESGPGLGENDLPAYSLDTGRPVANFDDIAIIPSQWEVA
ncbi:zinc dependent phospholipase C family protein [Desulfuromonas sp. TF]|uniref:zinc dependent phospholipase C family protein n=1 Tax=Desulfuromonas sp. TF TaxID=1232410 RepID=UPI000411224F|nr:zinc dependent phospholipase C family protein [Desulfuromonas sp. TF]